MALFCLRKIKLHKGQETYYVGNSGLKVWGTSSTGVTSIDYVWDGGPWGDTSGPSFLNEGESYGGYIIPLNVYLYSPKYNIRLTCQVFENQISSLSDDDKKQFPVCQYSPDRELIRGIFPSEAEFKKYKNSIEMSIYKRENGPQFVIYSWNVFSTLVFARECLKRFGESGDKFVLVYRDKTEQELNQYKAEKTVDEDVIKTTEESKNPYSRLLLESKNIILRGAPGTGKSFLAKAIAADIISNGYTDQYVDLTPEQKQQIEFVQFHPSYDYSDFVEGLRPKMNDDGSMGFELQEGIFKRFVAKARKNYEDSLKTKETVEQEMSILEAMNEFFSDNVGRQDPFTTTNGSEFYITAVNEGRVGISIPKNNSVNEIKINIDEIKRMLESDTTFEKNSDITRFLGVEYTQQSFLLYCIWHRYVQLVTRSLIH